MKMVCMPFVCEDGMYACSYFKVVCVPMKVYLCV